MKRLSGKKNKQWSAPLKSCCTTPGILNSTSDTTASTRSTSSTTSGTTQSTAYASSATAFSTESSTAWSKITFDTSQTSETTTQFDENCITYTHFGDVQFESVGGTFPATKLDKTRLDDFITIEDLHHCKKECASIAGCYQERIYLKKSLP